MSAFDPKRTLPSAVLTTFSLPVLPATMRLLGLGGAMKRREFITVLGGAAAWLLAAGAQQSAMPVIGSLSAGSSEMMLDSVAAFHRSLGDQGFTEGRNIEIEYRWTEGHNDRLPALS